MQNDGPNESRPPATPPGDDESLLVRRVFIDEGDVSFRRIVVQSVFAYWWLWIVLIFIALMSNIKAIENWADPVPLEYRINPFPVLKRELRAGDTLTTTTYRCNNTSGPITYINRRQWVRVDDEEKTPPIPIADTPITAGPGCVRAFSRRNQLPPELKEGVWIIAGTAIVQGRFREWTISYETDPFEVVP